MIRNHVCLQFSNMRNCPNQLLKMRQKQCCTAAQRARCKRRSEQRAGAAMGPPKRRARLDSRNFLQRLCLMIAPKYVRTHSDTFEARFTTISYRKNENEMTMNVNNKSLYASDVPRDCACISLPHR